jgi:hypothetical protein
MVYEIMKRVQQTDIIEILMRVMLDEVCSRIDSAYLYMSRKDMSVRVGET